MNENPSNINQTGFKTELSLDEFPIPDYQKWRKEVDRLLKGASFDSKMVSETYEGIKTQPIYNEKDIENLEIKNSYPGIPPYLRSNQPLGFTIEPHQIAQEISCTSIQEANYAIDHDLKMGQTSISFTLDKATRFALNPDQSKVGEVGRGGVSISSIADIEAVLKGIDIENIPVHIKAGTAALPFAALFFSFINKHNINANMVTGCIGTDPLGELAINGTLPISPDHAYKKMAILTDWVKVKAPNLKTISIDSQAWHNSGANAVEELAFTIATGADYLNAMLEKNLPVDTIAPRMRFSFSLGSKFFTEIAKLRAARILWAKVIDGFGGDDKSQKMFIHGRTSRYNTTVYDPHVNLLRATTEAFSGIMGGADSLHVGYYNESINQTDEFSRRLARNIQLILQMESHLDKVIDPAGGSWYIEKLTNEIAMNAWQLFQDIEAKGGMFESLKQGYPQQLIAKTAATREKNLAKRRDVLIGTNLYPNPNEKSNDIKIPDYEQIYTERVQNVKDFRVSINNDAKEEALEKLYKIVESSPKEIMDAAIEAALQGATIGEIAKTIRPNDFDRIDIYPINIQRVSEMFEIVRKGAEQYKFKTGAAPQVHLVKIGKLSQYKPRADFATGFFEIGGFEIAGGTPDDNIADAAADAVQSDSRVIVICSSDDNYPDTVPPLIKAIRKDKPDAIIVLAGYPKDQLELYKQSGVDEFISSTANAYELLARISQKIGVIS